jgi:hypothetical protein
MSELFGEYYDIDSHSILKGVSVDLIIEYLKEQMVDPYNLSTRNYVDEFIGDYEYSKKCVIEGNEEADDINDTELDEELARVEGYRNRFIEFVRGLFYNNLSIGLNEFDDIAPDKQDKILSVVYRYFVLNIKRNFLNLCEGYIEEHRNDLAKVYKRNGDITALAQKTRVTDPIDMIIISSLPEIINEIMNIEYPIDEFVVHTYGLEPPEYDAVLVKELIDKDIITGNFVPHYKKLASDYLLNDIEFIIKSSILSKYNAEKE